MTIAPKKKRRPRTTMGDLTNPAVVLGKGGLASIVAEHRGSARRLTWAEKEAFRKALHCSWERWLEYSTPELLEIATKMRERLKRSIHKLPPSMLLQYLQQIQNLTSTTKTGPTNVHNEINVTVEHETRDQLLARLDFTRAKVIPAPIPEKTEAAKGQEPYEESLAPFNPDHTSN